MTQIEQELLRNLAEKNANLPSATDAALLGAGLGAAAGSLRPASSGEILLSRMRGQPSPGRGFMKRAAGGLTGAILGGLLGPGARQIAIQQDPTAGALARLQIGQTQPGDMEIIEKALTSNYNSIGLA